MKYVTSDNFKFKFNYFLTYRCSDVSVQWLDCIP